MLKDSAPATIALATETELPTLLELINEVYLVERGDSGIAFKNCGRFDTLEDMQSSINCQNIIIYRGDADGPILGCIYFEVQKHPLMLWVRTQ